MRLLLWKPALVVSLIGLSLAGCTRGKSDNSSFSFSLPPQAVKAKTANAKLTAYGSATGGSALADATVLGHVVINITGDGISPAIVRTWDAHNGNNMPSTFTVENVRRGDGRLVQVLAVYEDQSTQSMTIYYGDLTKTLSSAEESAEITVASVSGTQTSVQGQINGRYFTSATGGPTGDLAIKFAPPGKPSMIVDRSVMYNGWFSVFALSNVTFTYEVQPGPMQTKAETLFGGPVNLHSSVFDPNQSSTEWNRRTAAYIPYHAREQYNNGSTSWNPEGAEIYVWGFWGSDAAIADTSTWSQRNVCRDSLSGSFTRMKVYTPDPTVQAAAAGLSISNLINFGLTPPTDAQLLDMTGTGSASSAVTFLGGGTACPPTGETAATEFANWMRVTKNQNDGNGSDTAAGFRLPFRYDSNLNPVQIATGSPGVITGLVLPGVASSIDEFRLYKKVNVSNDYRLDSPDCFAMANGAEGFVAAGGGAIDAANKMTVNGTITAADATSGVAAVLCPYKSGRPYASGLFIQSYAFQPGSGGGGMVPATTFKIVGPQSTNFAVTENTCTPFMVQGIANGFPANFPSGASLTFTPDNSGIAYYTDSICDTPGHITSPVTSSYGGDNYTFYVLVSDLNSHNLNVAVSGLTAPASVATVASYAPPGTPTPQLVVTAPSTIMAYTCYPITLSAWNMDAQTSSTGPTLFPFSGGPSFTMPTLTGLSFYANGNCSSSGGSFYPNFGSNIVQQNGSFMYTGTSSSINIQPTAASFSGTIAGTANVTVTQPGPAASLMITGLPNSVESGAPVPIQINVVDSQGHPTGAPAGGLTIDTISATGGGSLTYSSSQCMTSAQSSVMISQGQSSATTCFMSTAAAGTQTALTVTASANTAFTATSQNINVTAPTASQIVAVFTGQTLTGSSATPSNPTFLPNQSISVTFYALTSGGVQDSSFNYNVPIQGSSGLVAPPSSIQFTGGQATQALTVQSLSSPSSLSISLSNSNFQTPTHNINLSASASASSPTLFLYTASGVGLNNCVPVMIVPEISGTGGSQSAIPISYATAIAGSSVTLNSTVSGGAWYTDPVCSSPNMVTSFNLSVSQNSYIFFFKGTTASASGSISTTGPAYFSSVTPTTITVGSTTATSPSTWAVIGPANVMTGWCQPFLITTANVSGQFVPPTADVTSWNITPVAGPGGASDFEDFFANNDCATSAVSRTGGILFPASPGYKVVYGAVQSGSTGANVGDFGSTYSSVSFPSLYGY